MIYLYYISKKSEDRRLKKIKKGYYILIFLASLTVGAIIHDFGNSSFEIVKNQTAFAPIDDVSEVLEVVESDIDAVSDKINVNEADVYDLQRLKGIGEIMAERIIDYRTKNGKFEVIQDIMKVEGIGNKTFGDIKNYITVE